MSRRKKHTARDVKMYHAPQLIHNYDRETGRGPLHIADKFCTHNGHSKDMTRCGRIMYPDYRGFRRDETLENFRLCKRCGTPDEFTQAITEAAEWQGERLWLVALFGETQTREDKLGALKREILAEVAV